MKSILKYHLFFLLILAGISGAAQPDWAVHHGDDSAHAAEGILEYKTEVYVTGTLTDPMTGTERATFSKFDRSTGNLIWQRELDFPSVFNDFVYAPEDDLFILVGRTGDYVPGTDNASLAARIDLNGNLIDLKRFDQFDREEFTRIIRHPNAPDPAHNYYILVDRTLAGVGNLGRNEPGILNVDAGLTINESYVFTSTDGRELESARGLVPLLDGGLLLLGNDINSQGLSIPPNNGIIIHLDATGAVVTSWWYPGPVDFYDGVDLGAGQVMLAGHKPVEDEGCLLVVDIIDGFFPVHNRSFTTLGPIRDLVKGPTTGGQVSVTSFFFTAPVKTEGVAQNAIVRLLYSPFSGFSNELAIIHDEATDQAGRSFLVNGSDSLFYTATRNVAADDDSEVLIRRLPRSLSSNCTETIPLPFGPYATEGIEFEVTRSDGDDDFTDLMEVIIDPGLPVRSVCGTMISCDDLTATLSVEAECENGTYFADVSGGLPPYSFSWDFCDNSPILTTGNPTVSYVAMSPVSRCFDATVTISDANGCQVITSVELQLENEPPVLTCPDTTVILSADPGQCFATHDAIFTVTDDCIADPFVFSFRCNGGSRAPNNEEAMMNTHEIPVGTDCIKIRARDDFGSVAACEYDVLVLDQEAPTCPVPPTFTVQTTRCGDGADVSFPENFFTDNCTAPITYTYDPNGPVNGDFFPLGNTQINVMGTDTSGNIGNCLVTVVVERGCGQIGAATFQCSDDGYDLVVPYNPGILMQDTNCTYVVTINHPDLLLQTFTGTTGIIPGAIYFDLPTLDIILDRFVGISFVSNCICDDGETTTCFYTRSAEVECCLELSIADTVICRDQPTLVVPVLDAAGLPRISQVRYYIADPGDPFGNPIQLTNDYQDLVLSPTYHADDILVYAEVDFSNSACTTVATNVGTVFRCSPVTGSIPSQSYCYSGTPIQPDSLRITLGGDDPTLCGDSIQWFGLDGLPIPGATGLAYLPPALSLPADSSICDQRFIYTAQIRSVCGTSTASAEIRLFNQADLVGQLILESPDSTVICPGEDAILRYLPACTGDDMEWIWSRSTDGVTYLPLPEAGNRNPLYYTNRIYQDTWYSVTKTNGSCPVDTLVIFLDVRDRLQVNSLAVVADDVCLPSVAQLTVAAVLPTDCPNYTVTWFKDGVPIGQTNNTLSFNHPLLAGEGIGGNYYAEVISPCCNLVGRTPTISLTDPPFVVIAGPCFICNSDSDTLYAVVENAAISDVSFQWYVDGVPLAGAIDPFLEIFDHTGDNYLLEMTDLNGCVTTSTFTPYERCFTVGTDELVRINGKVYPNPVGEVLYLQLSDPVRFRQLTLYDALGRPVRVFTPPALSAAFELHIGDIPAGFYRLQGMTENGEVFGADIVR